MDLAVHLSSDKDALIKLVSAVKSPHVDPDITYFSQPSRFMVKDKHSIRKALVLLPLHQLSLPCPSPGQEL